MAISVNDILKITDVQTYLGQLTENVYFYRVDEIPTPPEGQTVYEWICNRFKVVVAAKVQDIQHNSCFHTLIRVDNVTNGVDFFELIVSMQGTNTGEGASSFEALNFVQRRSTLITRNGSKRIGGLPESATNANNFAGNPTVLATLETALAAQLVDASPTPVEFASPVIVGRKKYTTSKGKTDYELDLTKINPITGASFTAVSTQRSRKAGKGV